ncbi:hypothetical protein ACP70R_035928 [Stipagrostis hirtigluma subsp. patula]
MAMQLMEDSSTTIASLTDDLLAEIFVRLPSPGALACAALASRRWRGVASSRAFLQGYRSRHASSPLLGLYVPRAYGGLPSFQIADSVRSDAALDRFVRRGDFNLTATGLESHHEWHLLDCHAGRLLLRRGESRAVYDPLSGRRAVWLASLPGEFFSECLLRGHGDAASFRVVAVQHQRRGRDQMVRAAEYDSGAGQWRFHPWVNEIKRPQCDQAMHAGSLLFWRYQASVSLSLDTMTMEFSIVNLPTFLQQSDYAMGDTEDGRCCLVGLAGSSMYDLHLQVWLLQEDVAARSWKPDKNVPVNQVLGFWAKLRRVHAVTNGIAVLCWDERRQFMIDLKQMCLIGEFECAALGYPMQMPWPATVFVETGSEIIDSVVDLGGQDRLVMKETEMIANSVNASEISPCAIEAPHMHDLEEIEGKISAIGNENCELVVAIGEPSLQILEADANVATAAGPKRIEGPQMQTNDEDCELSLCNTEFVPLLQMITTQKGLQDVVLGLDDPCDTKATMATEANNLVATANKQVMAAEAQEVLATEETEANMMVDVHDNKMAHGSKTVSSSKLDHGGEALHCDQIAIHGSEMLQDIEMTHGSDTVVEAPPTESRHVNEMISNSKMDPSGGMVHCNQMVNYDGDMIQVIGMTLGLGNGIAEVAAPTTSIHCSEMVPSSKMGHGDEMIHCNQTVIHGGEMVQGAEMIHGSDTGMASPPIESRYAIEIFLSSKMDHAIEMIQFNQMVIHGSDSVEASEQSQLLSSNQACERGQPAGQYMYRSNEQGPGETELILSQGGTSCTSLLEAVTVCGEHRCTCYKLDGKIRGGYMQLLQDSMGSENSTSMTTSSTNGVCGSEASHLQETNATHQQEYGFDCSYHDKSGATMAKVAYDKDDPPMCEGSIYPSIEEFRVALAQHSVKHGFEYNIEKSDPQRLRAYCADKHNGCQWRIHASSLEDRKTIQVKVNRYKHTCGSWQRSKKMKNVSKAWIAEKVMDWVRDNAAIGTKELQRRILETHSVEINYNRVYNGYRRALEKLYKGSHEPGVTKRKRKGKAHECPICKQLGHHCNTCRDADPEAKEAFALLAAQNRGGYVQLLKDSMGSKNSTSMTTSRTSGVCGSEASHLQETNATCQQEYGLDCSYYDRSAATMAKVAYDKDDPPMCEGSVYPSIEEFRVALAQHSIKHGFEYNIEKTDPQRLRAYCADKHNGCQWRIHASSLEDRKTIMVKVNPYKHTCGSRQRSKKLKNASKAWIAETVMDWVRDNAAIGAKELQRRILETHSVEINYNRVYNGYRRALDKLYKGSHEPGVTKRKRKGKAHECPICKQFGHHCNTCRDADAEAKEAFALVAAQKKLKRKAQQNNQLASIECGSNTAGSSKRSRSAPVPI